MPKKGELSKTARASMANRVVKDHLTNHIDPITGEQILLSQLLPVQVVRGGKKFMVYYNKDTYKIQ
jgi:hypothetical protein